MTRHAQSLVEHAEEREAGRGADGEDLVVAAAVQVDQLVAREPGRLADGGEILAVIAHRDAHEVPADIAAGCARLREVARQPVVDRRPLGAARVVLHIERRVRRLHVGDARVQVVEQAPPEALDPLVDGEIDAIAEADVDAEPAHGSESRQLDSGGLQCRPHGGGDARGVRVVAVDAERARPRTRSGVPSIASTLPSTAMRTARRAASSTSVITAPGVPRRASWPSGA